MIGKAKVIIDESFAINDRYRVILKALTVPRSRKFPSGVRVKFVLVDSLGGYPRLLVDNHEPFGFHMHTMLPEDSSVRLALVVSDHNEALAVFLKEVERITQL